MKDFQYIIVGQGLAGSLLAHQLQTRSKSVLLVDARHERAATKIAAGLINPVTGRRLVKSWQIDELYAFAKSFYAEMAVKFGTEFFLSQPILKVFQNANEEVDWLVRSGEDGYEDLLLDCKTAGTYHQKIKPVHGVGRLQYTAQIRVATLIDCFRKQFVEQSCLLEEAFDYGAISFRESGIHYKEYTAEKIIFCEGYQAVFNPWFQYLPFELAKGEVLLVRIPKANFEEILKYKIFIVQ
ncbi:MAG: FAD-dependent oxidoreductase [Bacteroidota bacterium]